MMKKEFTKLTNQTFRFTFLHVKKATRALLLCVVFSVASCGVEQHSEDTPPDAEPMTSSGSDPLTPPGASDPGLVDLKTGKASFSQPLMSLGASTSPDYGIGLSYSTLGLYHQATTWNIEQQAIETGLGWNAPALHQKIFRNTRGTGIETDDTFYLQMGGSSMQLIYTGETKNTDGTIQSKSYTTTASSYSRITYYPPLNTVDPSKIDPTDPSKYQPGYWEIVNTNGGISRYGAYKSAGNIFKIKGITNPYEKEPGTVSKTERTYHYNSGDLLSDEYDSDSATLCRDVQINNGSSNDAPNRDPEPDSCNFIPIEYSVKWNSWIGTSGSTVGQENLEVAWNLAEIESPVNGLATTMSYVCHTQKVGSDGTVTNSSAKYFTLACYMYQVAGVDGSLLSINYYSQNSNTERAVAAADIPDSSEVIDNHMEDYEPDAYQEQYSVLRLEAIEKFEGIATNSPVKLASANIDYKWLQEPDNTNYMTKPVVAGVTYSTVNNELGNYTLEHSYQAAPSVLFDYFGQPGDNDGVWVKYDQDQFYYYSEKENYGAIYGGLKRVTSVAGGTVELTYTKNNLGNLQSQYFSGNKSFRDANDNLVFIPDQNRVPFWGADYMVLAGNGTPSAGGDDVTKFAIFTFTASGWKLSNVIEADYAAPISGFSEENSAFLKSSPVKDLVAVSDSYFAYLSPVEDSSGKGLTCADVYTVHRNRDASRSDEDWGQPQRRGTSSYCVENITTYWTDASNNSGSGDNTYTRLENKLDTDNFRFPSLSANGSVVAVAGNTSEEQSNFFSAWKTYDDGITFESIADNQEFSGDVDMPIVSFVGAGYVAAYGISFDLASTENQLHLSLLPIDGNTIGEIVTSAANYKNTAFETKWRKNHGSRQLSFGFSPKVIQPWGGGGFPAAEVVGGFQYIFMGSDDLTMKVAQIPNPSAISPLQDSAASLVVWFPVESSDGVTSVSTPLISYPFTEDSSSDSGYSNTIEENDNNVSNNANKRLTASYATPAIGDGGVFWAGFTSLYYPGAGEKQSNRSWFTCHFDRPVYDDSSASWSIETKSVTQSGTETNSLDNSTCFPAEYTNDSFSKNASISTSTAGQGIYSTLGHSQEYKYWSYAPMGDRSSGDGSPVLLANAGGDYAASYEAPKLKPKKWASTWFKVESALGEMMNVGFTMMMARGAATGNPLDIAFLVWQFASEAVNKTASNAYKKSLGSSGYHGLGRYLIDGEQLWYVTHDARLESTNGYNLLNDGYAVAQYAKYFGSSYNFVAVRGGEVESDGTLCNDSSVNNCEMYFTKLKNGNIFKSDTANAGMEQVVLASDSASDVGEWFIQYSQPPGTDDDNTCANNDCTSNSSMNAFLIYDGSNNKSFSDAGLDFQLQRISSKNSVNNHYDYAVSSVTTNDGFDSFTTSYEYTNDGDSKEPITYGSVSGVTAIYSQVAVYLDDDSTTNDGHTKYNFYTTNPVPIEGQAEYALQPEVLYNDGSGSQSKLTSANTLMGQVMGMTYRVDSIRSNDGQSVQSSNTLQLIKDVAQQDANDQPLTARRAALAAETTSIADGSARVRNFYTYNDYFQTASTTTNRTHFNHSAVDGVPNFDYGGAKKVTKTTVPIYTWQVTDDIASEGGPYTCLDGTQDNSYACYIQSQNRLSEVYLTQSLIKDGVDNQAYIKSASAGLYAKMEQPTTGIPVYLTDQSYSLVNPRAVTQPLSNTYQSWMSPSAITSGASQTPASWLKGSTVTLRDYVTLAAIESQAPTGETATSFSAYAPNEDRGINSLAYPYRWTYASFAGVQQKATQVAYIGFERYEAQWFDKSDAEIVDNTPVYCDLGNYMSVIGGVVSTGNANTGNRYCQLTSDAGWLFLGPSFDAKPSVDYVVSVWVRPSKGVSCALQVGSGARSSTAYYKTTTEPVDGSWYYLEDTVPSGSIQTILRCTGPAGFDDLRIAPVNSGFSAVVYDTNPTSNGYLMPMAAHSDRGHIVRTLYDHKRQPYVGMVQDINLPQPTPGFVSQSAKMPHQYSYASLPLESGFSRWQGYSSAYGQDSCAMPINASDSFLPATPNSVIKIGVKGLNAGQYLPLVSTTKSLYLNDTDGFALRFITSDDSDGYGRPVTMEWTAQSGASQSVTQTITLVNNTLQYNGTTTVLPAMPQYVTLAAQAGSFILVGDGKLLLSDFSSGAPTAYPALPVKSSHNSEVEVTLSGMSQALQQVVLSPISGAMGAIYANAFGAAIEGHALSGYWDAGNSKFHFTDVASASYHDGYGRTAVSTLPVEYTALGDSTDRDYQPQNNSTTTDLLAFRGVGTDSTGKPYRNFSAINWSNGTAVTIDPNDNATTLNSDLVGYYSKGGPGKKLFNNSVPDANYALVSNIAYKSPLARQQKATVMPGADYKRTSDDDPTTDKDLAILSGYQEDPLGLIGEMSLDDIGSIQVALYSPNNDVSSINYQILVSTDDGKGIQEAIVGAGAIDNASDDKSNLTWVTVGLPGAHLIVDTSNQLLQFKVKNMGGWDADTRVYVRNIILNDNPVNFGPTNGVGQVAVNTVGQSPTMTECVSPAQSTRKNNSGGDSQYKSWNYTFYLGKQSTCVGNLGATVSYANGGYNNIETVTQQGEQQTVIALYNKPQLEMRSNEVVLSFQDVPAQAVSGEYNELRFYGGLRDISNDPSLKGASAIAQSAVQGGYYFLTDYNLEGSPQGIAVQAGALPPIAPGGQLWENGIATLVLSVYTLYYMGDDIPSNLTLYVTPTDDSSVTNGKSLFIADTQTKDSTGEWVSIGYGSSNSSNYYYPGVMGEIALGDSDNSNQGRMTCISPIGSDNGNKQCDKDTLGNVGNSWGDSGDNWVQTIMLAGGSKTGQSFCDTTYKNNANTCASTVMVSRPDDGSSHRYKLLIGTGAFWSTDESENMAQAPRSLSDSSVLNTQANDSTNDGRLLASSNSRTSVSEQQTLKTMPLGLLQLAQADSLSAKRPTNNSMAINDYDSEGSLVLYRGDQYGYSQQQYPGGNKKFGFSVNDLWGGNMVSAVSWDDTGNAPSDTATLQTLYSGSAYQLNGSELGVDAVSQTQARQPNWYTQADNVTEDNTQFTEQSFVYDLLGLWTSGQGSDSEDGHAFVDKSGRTRLTTINPGFADAATTPGNLQIGAYIQLDDLGRPVESGRLKDAKFSADQWLAYAQSITTSNPDGDDDILGDSYTCKIATSVYDSYGNATTLWASGGIAIVPPTDSGNTRSKIVQSTRYNRQTSSTGNSDKWNSGPVSSQACDDSTDKGDPNNSHPIDYISDTFVFDDLGRVASRYSNRVSGGDFENAHLYQTAYQFGTYDDSGAYADNTYTDVGNYTIVSYPDDALGNTGNNMKVKTTFDRLGRVYKVKPISGNTAITNSMGDKPIFKQGKIQLGLTLSSKRPNPGLHDFTQYNFQGQITQLCQTTTSAACSASGAEVVYQEDLAYANDVTTSGTPSATACSDLGYYQYSNSQLAYVKKSGLGFYDPAQYPDSDTDNISEECYSYDGAGRLLKVARMVDASAGYQKYSEEVFAYDSNGNMGTRTITDYYYKCEKNTTFTSKTTNNQLSDVTYGAWNPTSENKGAYDCSTMPY
jgi:hypothetical protein